ncbi:MAG: class I SAM-dependent methyltransferase [Phycisphaeraceae bacterium]|nr:class I SAM-dependent methyltransferase [Phycisphaeraceae bacterium]
MNDKSTVAEIRARFDADVERFSHLETGQSAMPDSPLFLDLVTEAAATVCPRAASLLDIGCGAGNYSLKMLERLPNLSVTLVDLSQPMLDRAQGRITQVLSKSNRISAIQGDVRAIDLGRERHDIVLAAAVLHHLRGESEWRDVFRRVYQCLKPGGCFWIVDAVLHSEDRVQELVWRRWGEYLVQIKDEQYRDAVMDYVRKEDTPRPLMWQLDLLREMGFTGVDVLHKRLKAAAFGGIKA